MGGRTKEYTYHFSRRKFFKITFEAESLEEAIESLEWCGVDHAIEENDQFLEDKNISWEEEYYDNESQWEVGEK